MDKAAPRPQLPGVETQEDTGVITAPTTQGTTADVEGTVSVGCR